MLYGEYFIFWRTNRSNGSHYTEVERVCDSESEREREGGERKGESV